MVEDACPTRDYPLPVDPGLLAPEDVEGSQTRERVFALLDPANAQEHRSRGKTQLLPQRLHALGADGREAFDLHTVPDAERFDAEDRAKLGARRLADRETGIDLED